MAQHFWIKLYHAILDDAKMGRLPDALWRRTVELNLLAGEQHAGGFLPPVEDIAWRLHVSDEVLQAELETLCEFGIVELREQGWYVIGFIKRQAAATSAERSRKHRALQRRREFEAAADAAVEKVPPLNRAKENATGTAEDGRPNEAAAQPGHQRAVGGTKRRTDRNTDAESESDSESATPPPGGGKSARDPPPKLQKRSPAKQRAPLTDSQRCFLELFGAKRYRNGTQRDTVLALERAHGRERLLDKARWAANLGLGLGKAIVAVESAFKNERKDDGRDEKRSPRAATGSGRKASRGGVDTRAREEVQRGLTQDQMDAKLARLQRTAGQPTGRTGTAGDQTV